MKVSYLLDVGAHESPADGMCAMEWVAYLAGEPHTDTPRCVDHELSTLFVRLNDLLPGNDRQQLRRWLPRTIGTWNDGRTAERRRALRNWVMDDYLPNVARCPSSINELGEQVYAAHTADRVAAGALPVARLYDEIIDELRRRLNTRGFDPAPVWRLLDALLPGELLDTGPVDDEHMLPSEMAAALATGRGG